MGLMRKAGALGVLQMIIREARKPQNQAKIKQAVAEVQKRRAAGRTR